MAIVLTEYLDHLLSLAPNIINSEQDIHLNIEKIKEVSLEELEAEDKIALVLILLKQLQSYISMEELSSVLNASHF